MYHAIGSPALGDAQGLFSLSPELFEAHLDHLMLHHSGSVVALDPGLVIGDEVQIAISFDDGYLDNLEIAAPLLVARGLPFTVFVSADFVKRQHPGFLTPAAVRELSLLPGARIGAHGTRHLALSECDDTVLHEELTAGKAYLEDMLGLAVDTMAYPYGATNQRVRQAVKDAGFCLAACSYADTNRSDRDRLLLGRSEILAGDTLRVFRQKLHGDWDWYRWRTQDPACL